MQTFRFKRNFVKFVGTVAVHGTQTQLLVVFSVYNQQNNLQRDILLYLEG